MLKVKGATANREPIPTFLRGLAAESLADLSWTDPQLGVSDCAWWPEEAGNDEINPETHRHGDEILTPDPQRRVVVVTREIVPLTEEELAERAAVREQQARDEAAQVQRELTDAVQRHLDQQAQAHGYDGIQSAALRAALPNSPFHLEGVAYGEWMDAVWSRCYAIQAEVAAGERPVPTAENLIAELPELVLPA